MNTNKTISLSADLVTRTLGNIQSRNKGDTFSGVVADQLEKWNAQVEKSLEATPKTPKRVTGPK